MEKKVFINTSIPGYKSEEQLITMGRLIRTLKWGSTIVEIGSCAGRGTWTISQNAPLFSRVYAVDQWSETNSLVGAGQLLSPEKVADKAYFLSNIKKCRNVIPLQGDAREIPFQKSVDCLLIDCDLGRGKNDHISIWQKWQPLLAKKALVVGANYFPSRRDDEVFFAEFIRSQTNNLNCEHGIWWSHYSHFTQ